MQLEIIQDNLMENTTSQQVEQKISFEVMLKNQEHCIAAMNNEIAMLKLQNEALSQKTQRLLKEFEDLELNSNAEDVPDAERFQQAGKSVVLAVEYDKLRLHYAKAVVYLRAKLENCQK